MSGEPPSRDTVPPCPSLSDANWECNFPYINSGSFCTVHQIIEPTRHERKRRYVAKRYKAILLGGVTMDYAFLREWYSLSTMDLMASAGLCENSSPPIVGLHVGEMCGVLTMEEGLCLSDVNAMNIVRREMDSDEKEGRGRFALVEEICQSAWAALANLHACGFMHRDIKPSNMVLRMSRTGDGWCTLDRPAQLLVIDMNSARPTLHPNQASNVDACGDGGTSRVCSIHTRAPEICQRVLLRNAPDSPKIKEMTDFLTAKGVPSTYGTAADVWSMGMCLLAVVSSVVNPTDTASSIRSSRFWKRVCSRIIRGRESESDSDSDSDSEAKMEESENNIRTLCAVMNVDSCRGGIATNWFRKQQEPGDGACPRVVRSLLRSLDRALVLQPKRRENAFVLACGTAREARVRLPPPPDVLLASSREIRVKRFRECQGDVAGLARFDSVREQRKQASMRFMNESKGWEVAVIGNILLEAWAGCPDRYMDEHTVIITLTFAYNVFSTRDICLRTVMRWFPILQREYADTLRKRWEEVAKVVMEAMPMASWLIHHWYMMLRESGVHSAVESELSTQFLRLYFDRTIHVEDMEAFMKALIDDAGHSVSCA